nr:DUF1016 family protein [bacterium]
IINSARKRAYSSVNSAMVEAYWKIGKRIVEEEQEGNERAQYGTQLLKFLANELNSEFGKGFDERELRRIRQFYLTFPIRDTLRPELSWSHYRLLIRVSNEKARNYYLNEAADQSWSYRTLDRNYSTNYYERLLSSQNIAPVINEMKQKSKSIQNSNHEFVKNPYVLEFLNIPQRSSYTESKLEEALLTNIQQLLLELGKGFSFVARQKLIRTETSDFFVDLVFYNYILKCFVLIDLKTTKLNHQDVGQMDMYVRMFDDLKKSNDDNPTIGILLCSETDNTIVKYSVLNESKQLFASKYLLYLPTEEELASAIEEERSLLEESVVYDLTQ